MDTILEAIPNAHCDDCGVQKVAFQHWGHLVPSGVRGKFCEYCLQVRGDRFESGKSPLPLGQTLYTERCTGKFTLLRFPDVERQHEPISVSTKELGQRMTRDLGFPVGHMEGTMCICEFVWKPGLDEVKINTYLNELRRQYPQMTITGNDHSFFPPGGF